MTPVNPVTLDALSQGITAEVAAYVFYLKASQQPLASAMKTVLEDLALEEKKHFHILERQHHSLVNSEQWISLADVLKEDRLPEINEDMTSEHKELIEKVEKADSIGTLLDIAYQLETEARDVYLREAESVDSAEGKKVFAELARFEEGHMKKIESMRKEFA